MDPIVDLFSGCSIMKKFPYIEIHWDSSGRSGCVYARNKRDLIVFFGKSFYAGEHRKVKRFATMVEAVDYIKHEYETNKDAYRERIIPPKRKSMMNIGGI